LEIFDVGEMRGGGVFFAVGRGFDFYDLEICDLEIFDLVGGDAGEEERETRAQGVAIKWYI